MPALTISDLPEKPSAFCNLSISVKISVLSEILTIANVMYYY
jgi:hypothetical protein